MPRKTFRGVRLLTVLVVFYCLWVVLAHVFRGNVAPEAHIWAGWAFAVLAAGCLLYSASVWVREALGRLFRPGGLFRTPEYVTEVVEALARMVGQRMGALIVVERGEPLQGVLNSAIEFDADVNAEVLVSLFAPGSRVHDGAVVIRDGRIRSVKTILPLATKAQVPLGIGTRHRSAIGITEGTDAVALVVSEERGELSVAFEGKLTRVSSQEELLKMLKSLLRKPRVRIRGKES